MSRNILIAVAWIGLNSTGHAATLRLEPVYPAAALEQCVEGIVELEITFGADGSVHQVRTIAEQPEGYFFGQAAEQAVRGWRFDAEEHPEGSVLRTQMKFELDKDICTPKEDQLKPGANRTNTDAAQPNKALQTDKDKLSCLLHSQEPRQLAFAAELGRYTS